MTGNMDDYFCGAATGAALAPRDGCWFSQSKGVSHLAAGLRAMVRFKRFDRTGVNMEADEKVRYALVGTGSRARMFIDPLVTRFRDVGELVALADPNPGRLAYHNRILAEELAYRGVSTYHSDDFD